MPSLIALFIFIHAIEGHHLWIPAGGLYLLAALTLGVRWLRAAERQVFRQAR